LLCGVAVRSDDAVLSWRRVGGEEVNILEGPDETGGDYRGFRVKPGSSDNLAFLGKWLIACNVSFIVVIMTSISLLQLAYVVRIAVTVTHVMRKSDCTKTWFIVATTTSISPLQLAYVVRIAVTVTHVMGKPDYT
jgi:hypothetical protein